MLTPIFGHLGESKCPISGGASCDSGFKIQFKNFWHTALTVGDYHKYNNNTDRNLVIVCEFLTVLTAYFVSLSLLQFILRDFTLLHRFTTSTIIYSGATLTAIWAWLIFNFCCFKNKYSAREWHALEHKSIMLLQEGLEPNVGNLKMCPFVLMDCGTSRILIVLEILSLFWLSLFFNAITLQTRASLQLHFAMAHLIVLIMLCSISFVGFALGSGPRYSYLLPKLMPLFWPGLFLPIMVEKYFTTMEPSPEKIEIAIITLKEFLNEIEAKKQTGLWR